MPQSAPPIFDYRTPDRPSPSAWTPRAIVWTVIGCTAGLLLLISILIPSLGTAKEPAKRVMCASNLRQIGQGMALYHHDHRVWPQTLAQIMVGAGINAECFTCPSSGTEKALVATTQEAVQALASPKHCSYVYFPAPADAKSFPAETVLIVERLENHSHQGMNVLFGDGHAEWFDLKTSQFILNELNAGHNPPRWPTTRPAK